MRKVSVVAAIAIMIMVVGCGSSGVGFVVQLEYEPLRVWDGEELPNVETASNESAPSLNSIVNISLSCKVYEDSDYKFIRTCRTVPDDHSVWVVEVKGDGGSQSFDFGQSANIFMDWDSDAVNLVDRTLSNALMKDVTKMTVTLK